MATTQGASRMGMDGRGVRWWLRGEGNGLGGAGWCDFWDGLVLSLDVGIRRRHMFSNTMQEGRSARMIAAEHRYCTIVSLSVRRVTSSSRAPSCSI